jgi:hypothetical protein
MPHHRMQPHFDVRCSQRRHPHGEEIYHQAGHHPFGNHVQRVFGRLQLDFLRQKQDQTARVARIDVPPQQQAPIRIQSDLDERVRKEDSHDFANTARLLDRRRGGDVLSTNTCSPECAPSRSSFSPTPP